MTLGETGIQALLETGKKFGKEAVEQKMKKSGSKMVSFEEKLHILKDSASMLGLYPEFDYNDDKTKIYFKIFNCPFKEMARNEEQVCEMHNAYITGMFESLFSDVELIEKENMLEDCKSCSYQAVINN